MSFYNVTLFIFVDYILRPNSSFGPAVILYVGPDQILPLMSFLGAIIGVVLMFWRYLVNVAGKIWQFFTRR